jgi:hypothetical protein
MSKNEKRELNSLNASKPPKSDDKKSQKNCNTIFANFTPTEVKILRMTLKDDDRVQQHYHYLFNCHYLPDLIQVLRRKFEKLLDTDGKEIMPTEYHKVIKIDGKKANIGIYRIDPRYKKDIKKYLDDFVKSIYRPIV